MPEASAQTAQPLTPARLQVDTRRIGWLDTAERATLESLYHRQMSNSAENLRQQLAGATPQKAITLLRRYVTLELQGDQSQSPRYGSQQHGGPRRDNAYPWPAGDRMTGAWSLDVPGLFARGKAPTADLLVAGERIFIATSATTEKLARVLCYRLGDGTPLWEQDLPRMLHPILEWDQATGELLAWDEYAQAKALDPASGRIRRAINREVGFNDGAGRPLLVGRTAYVPLDGGIVQAVDLDSAKTLWLRPSTVHRSAAFVGNDLCPDPLTYADGRLYGRCGQRGGGAFAMDAQSGELLWRKTWHVVTEDRQPNGNCALADGRLYVYTQHALRCLDAQNGETLWEVPDLLGKVMSRSALAVKGKTLYLAERHIEKNAPRDQIGLYHTESGERFGEIHQEVGGAGGLALFDDQRLVCWGPFATTLYPPSGGLGTNLLTETEIYIQPAFTPQGQIVYLTYDGRLGVLSPR